jgi:hypothetical protein
MAGERVTIVGGKVAAAVVAWAIASAAAAQTPVPCDLAPTTALGNAVALANPGAILAITGICQQQVAIASVLQWGLTLTNHSGNPKASLDTDDGIAGQLQIVGPLQVAINGIKMVGPASDQGSVSVLYVRGGMVLISNVQIINGWRNGLVVDTRGSAVIKNTMIQGHGAANIAGEADGIRIMQGSALALGDEAGDGSINAADAVTIENNAGNGIAALGASTMTVAGATIQANGASQVFIAGASEANLVGTQVKQTAASTLPGNFAIQAMQSSKLLLMQGSSIQAGTSAGGVLTSSSSSLTTIGSTITNNSAASPTIEASGSSNVLLAGGNIVANGAANGIAVEIDHSSSLMQTAVSALAAEFAGVPVAAAAAADTITGAGVIQEQSSMDLGVGLVGGLNGLVWNGTFMVAQNSSFRLSGGTSISGSVTLGQASNGFFNVSKGGTNSVAGGVSCPWATVPSSHVTGAASVSPSPAIAPSFLSATKGQCLPF